MTHTYAVHQVLHSLSYGDAISNAALTLQGWLRGWGYCSDICAAHRGPGFANRAYDYRRYHSQASDVLIYHYAIGSPLTEWIMRWPGRVILCYHNVTPPHLLRSHSPQFQTELAQGRAMLASLRDVFCSVADSEYNRIELLELGFESVETIPVAIDFSRLDSTPSPAAQAICRRFDDGAVTLLFVGRIVPNKRQQDLITLLAYYQRLVQSHARLVLVGSPDHAPTYQIELESLADSLGVQDVVFWGQVSDQELAACYHTASVFVCLSEHEGMGVPLLEAMYCGLPVLAYAAAAVPYTMGSAGVLVHRKRYDVLAELVDLLAKDTALRAQIIQRQRQHVTQFYPGVIAGQWQRLIHACVEGRKYDDGKTEKV